MNAARQAFRMIISLESGRLKEITLSLVFKHLYTNEANDINLNGKKQIEYRSEYMRAFGRQNAIFGSRYAILIDLLVPIRHVLRIFDRILREIIDVVFRFTFVFRCSPHACIRES